MKYASSGDKSSVAPAQMSAVLITHFAVVALLDDGTHLGAADSGNGAVVIRAHVEIFLIKSGIFGFQFGIDSTGSNGVGNVIGVRSDVENHFFGVSALRAGWIIFSNGCSALYVSHREKTV